jgi:hypothetical protein
MKPNLKVLFILAIGILASSSVFSQGQFKLSDYKNPDYKWQSLNVQFGLGGSNLFNKQEVDNGSNEKNITSSFSNDLEVDYYRTKNSLHYQGSQDARMTSVYNSSNINYHDLNNSLYDDSQKKRVGSIRLNFISENRFYNNRKMFFETDFNLVGNYNHNKTLNSAESEAEYFIYKDIGYNYSLSAELPLLAGIGRIEQVQDARLAVYILDDLMASGDLKRVATNDEINSLAEFITNLKNQRYFDTRLEKISQVTAIDSFLTVKGLKSQSIASYYTLIYDNWDYADGPVRATGGRFSFGLAPSIGTDNSYSETFQRDSTDTEDMLYTSYGSESNTNEWDLAFLAGYVFEKPSSLYWQHTFKADAAYLLHNQDEKFRNFNDDNDYYKFTTKTDSPELALGVSYKIGYYPNSRTSITLKGTSAYDQTWGNSEQDNGDEIKTDLGQKQLDSGIDLYCSYYLSPQLRLTISAGSDYTWSLDNKAHPDDTLGDSLEHNLHNYISAGLVYKIF